MVFRYCLGSANYTVRPHDSWCLMDRRVFTAGKPKCRVRNRIPPKFLVLRIDIDRGWTMHAADYIMTIDNKGNCAG